VEISTGTRFRNDFADSLQLLPPTLESDRDALFLHEVRARKRYVNARFCRGWASP